MTDNNNTGPGTTQTTLSSDATGQPGAKRPYQAPRVLGAEPLEAAAATCDGSGGFGKSVPTCSPATLGS